ncbi:MAG: prolipoprotein diacylglyceryl transferase [Bacillota bacterium]
MNPVAFKIGSLGVRWYGIIIGSAVVIAFFLAIRESKKQGINEEFFYDFVIFGLPAAIIGARLYYVIFEWPIYKNNLNLILNIRQGGLAIHGGIIGGLIVLLILVKKYKVDFWKIVDILAPSLILGQAIGRWGNFINQEAYGGVVSLEFINKFPDFIKNQMFINGQYHHPAFLYESMWNFLSFLILIILRRKEFIKKGDVFALYLILYSSGRFFIEKIRTDSLLFQGIMVARLISIIMIIVGIIIIIMRHRRENKRNVE